MKRHTSIQKALFLDHKTHLSGTHSSDFFIEILAKYFDLTVSPYDGAWKKVVSKKFDVLFVWQYTGKPEDLLKFCIKNIVMVPMYDDCPNTVQYWKSFYFCKVFCFTKAIYSVARQAGLHSFYAQFFFENDVKNTSFSSKAFFWDRGDKVVTSEKVVKLCEQLNIKKLIVHQCRSENLQSDTVKIQKTNWFDAKNDYYDVIDTASIYFAPRKSEGIGLSFLEAMSKGKIVIAFDAPSMNEYIINGQNGFLFNESCRIANPKSLRRTFLSNIQEMSQHPLDLRWKRATPEFIAFFKTNLKVKNKNLFFQLMLLFIKPRAYYIWWFIKGHFMSHCKKIGKI